MAVFYGNTSSNATSTAYSIVSTINFFSLVNKSGGTITVNMGILYGSTYSITPYSISLADGEAYISNDRILVPIAHQISITTSGSLDYYVVIE